MRQKLEKKVQSVGMAYNPLNVLEGNKSNFSDTF